MWIIWPIWQLHRVPIKCNFPLRLHNLHVSVLREFCLVWNGVFVCSFVLLPASLHSVFLLDSTYLWFTFQLCFFSIFSFGLHSFLLFSFISCLLFGFFCALKNFYWMWEQSSEWTCVSCRERHMLPVLFGPLHPSFLPPPLLFFFLPCQYSHSAFIPHEFFWMPWPRFLSLSLVSRIKRRGDKGGQDRGGLRSNQKIKSMHSLTEERKKQTLEVKRVRARDKMRRAARNRTGLFGLAGQWTPVWRVSSICPRCPTSLLSHPSNLTRGCPE